MTRFFPWTLLFVFLLAAFEAPVAVAQTGQIEGTVVDGAGAPLPGVNVVVEGTQRGASTDTDGAYAISGLEPGTYALQASFVGYTSQVREGVEVAGGETAVVDFTMEQGSVNLDDLVVVGYGSQQRRDLTGAVSSVSAADMEASEASSVTEALQGRVSGVQVTESSSGPGGGLSVRIRGSGSVGASNESLYVVDGVPIQGSNDDADPLAGNFFTQNRASSNKLAFLNPSDVESIEVLKDASATAIYGARGANGVILITTKQGRAGETRVDFESSIGVSQEARRFEVLDGQQFAEFANEYAALDDNLEQPFANPSQFGKGTNYQDLIFRDALTQNYQLGVRGGTEATSFSLSGNYSDQQGIVKGTNFKRYSFKANITQDVSEALRVGANVTASRLNNTQGLASGGGGRNESSAVTGARGMIPILSPTGPDGAFMRNDVDFPAELDSAGFSPEQPFENPLAAINEVQDEQEQDRVIGNLFAELDLAEGMQFCLKGAANILNSGRNQYFSSRTIQGGRGRGGQANSATTEINHYLLEGIFSYDRTLGENHSLDITAGSTLEYETSFFRFLDNTNFTNDILGFRNIGAGTAPRPNVGTGTNEWTLISYLGRANYIFADKYLLTVNGRFDGSSKFGAT